MHHARSRATSLPPTFWLTAAIGVAAGLGRLGLSLVATVLDWIVLAVLVRFESSTGRTDGGGTETPSPSRPPP